MRCSAQAGVQQAAKIFTVADSVARGDTRRCQCGSAAAQQRQRRGGYGARAGEREAASMLVRQAR